MKHIKITAFDCPDAWFQTLNTIWNKGDSFQVGYGSEVTETKKLNLSIEIRHPENRPLVSDKAPCDMKYVNWYALAYLWCGEKQDETYTYGSRIRDPVDQVEEAGKKIARYLRTGNTENLIDAANYCMVAFMSDSHPTKHFESQDDSPHATRLEP